MKKRLKLEKSLEALRNVLLFGGCIVYFLSSSFLHWWTLSIWEGLIIICLINILKNHIEAEKEKTQENRRYFEYHLSAISFNKQKNVNQKDINRFSVNQQKKLDEEEPIRIVSIVLPLIIIFIIFIAIEQYLLAFITITGAYLLPKFKHYQSAKYEKERVKFYTDLGLNPENFKYTSPPARNDMPNEPYHLRKQAIENEAKAYEDYLGYSKSDAERRATDEHDEAYRISHRR